MLVRMWRNSSIAGRIVKWYRRLGNNFLKKTKHEIPQDPENPLLDIYPRETKIYVHKKPVPKCL